MFELSECDICDICFWQNDAQDLAAAVAPRGPNHVSLIEAQHNYARYGACEERFVENVRAPGAGESRDPGWRPFEPTNDAARVWDNYEEAQAFQQGPYYWRPSYWLRSSG